jgi:branched-subunit amino acid aminotransferase/4-amino-4-deoxychorismate lyase
MLQVLAATEARVHGAEEVLLINTEGNVAECGSSNLFWIEQGTVCTPPTCAGALPGVTRGVVLECCRTLAIPSCERNVRPEHLQIADGVFLTLTSRGIVEAGSLDGLELRSSPLTRRLQLALEDLVQAECA